MKPKDPLQDDNAVILSSYSLTRVARQAYPTNQAKGTDRTVATEKSPTTDHLGGNGRDGDTKPSLNSPSNAPTIQAANHDRTRQLALEHHKNETLLQIIMQLTSSLEVEQVLQQTLEILNKYIGASHVTCMVHKRGESRLWHVASVGYPNPVPRGGWPSALSTEQGLVGWILKNRQPALLRNVLQDERWLQLPGSEYQHRSAIGVPLMLGNELLGVLLLFHPQEDYFSEDQLDLITAAANQMAVAIHNAELYALTRSQAEELGQMLKRQEVETRRSQAILEAIAEGVLVTDREGRVTLFNASAARILKLERKEVIGRSLAEVSDIFGGAGRSWMETILSWSQDPTTRRQGDTFTEQITLCDGRVVAVNLAPVTLSDESFGTVSIFHDITHQIEVNRLKSEFVATVSHELRTPMTSIKGYVDLILMGAAGELDPQQRRFLEIVKNNTDRLAILVNDLLDLSRIEAGRVTLTMQPIDLATLAEELMVEMRRRSLSEQNLQTFVLEIPPDLPLVIGDLDRVRQILANLVGNAYRYTPSGGRICVQAHRLANEVRVDIIDTGIGIPPAEQQRVFERFYRGESSLVMGTSGSGLGLSIVQQLIHMHHGRIWLRSSGIAGEGSTFSFTLPIFEAVPLLEENQSDG